MAINSHQAVILQSSIAINTSIHKTQNRLPADLFIYAAIHAMQLEN